MSEYQTVRPPLSTMSSSGPSIHRVHYSSVLPSPGWSLGKSVGTEIGLLFSINIEYNIVPSIDYGSSAIPDTWQFVKAAPRGNGGIGKGMWYSYTVHELLLQYRCLSYYATTRGTMPSLGAVGHQCPRYHASTVILFAVALAARPQHNNIL